MNGHISKSHSKSQICVEKMLQVSKWSVAFDTVFLDLKWTKDVSKYSAALHSEQTIFFFAWTK